MVKQLAFGVFLGAVVLAALSWSPARRWWKAGVMLTALSSAQAAAPPAAERPDPDRLVEEDVTVPGRDGPYPGAHLPARRPDRAGAGWSSRTASTTRG